MSQVCYTSQCPAGSCCDQYAYCAFNLPIQYCYAYVEYYYDNYWWIYFTVSMVILCIIMSVLGGMRRRRRRLARENQIIIETGANPSYVQGMPVYPGNGGLVTGVPVEGGNMTGMYGQGYGVNQGLVGNGDMIYGQRVN